MFNLHPQLASDGIVLGNFKLSKLLLSNDAQYPWFILVPRREAITEIYQLSPEDRAQLLNESCVLSAVLSEVFAADKLNIAALGNMVSQLHVHHIVRYRDDPAWPAPVWGKLPAVAYGDDQLRDCVARLKSVAINGFVFAEQFR